MNCYKLYGFAINCNPFLLNRLVKYRASGRMLNFTVINIVKILPPNDSLLKPEALLTTKMAKATQVKKKTI